MTVQILINRAIPLHQAGRLSEAAALYRQAIATDQRNFQARYLLAALYYQQQHVPEALAQVDAALAINPNAAEAVMLSGTLLRAAGRHEEAVARLGKAVALNPRYAEAWHNLGTALLDLGRAKDAAPAFEKVLTLEPRNASAHYNRGLALQTMERPVEALDSYRQALAIRPDLTAAHYNIGTLLINARENLDEALAHFDTVLAREPRNQKAWTGRAKTLSGMKRFGEALESADQALAIAPDHAPAVSIRGTVLLESNRLAEAMASFMRHAALAHGDSPSTSDVPHKQRHDQEQQAHLAAKGISLPRSLYLGEGAALAGPAVNPMNVESATRTWLTAKPQLVVIDNLLTDEALTRLREYCLDSTIWRRSYPGGYLGAVPESGFAAPLLTQIADELRDTFPAIFEDHGLRYLWGFKYDSSLNGIKIHADFAAVNVNFWITPDDANLDPDHGGLVVWDVSAPLDWNFAQYNADEDAMRAFLAGQGAKSITVPYRCNRAVIFDSDLFHETDRISFKPGYRNRRINVTMLYGRRKSSGT
jgi:tetratricopeptide (TPR) repeat protein